MALVKGTNSYATLEEANTYFLDRLDVNAWTAASDTQKSQALVTATSILDRMDWTGVAISEAQALAFPRSGSYFEPKIGYVIELPAIVPDRIIKATFEQAYHLLNNDGLLDNTGSVNSLQVGTISLDIKTNPSVMPSVVLNLVKPLQSNGGARLWWRSN
jgi:hypothetical protein